MNKLSNKEVILILVVINIALYYLLFAIGISPVKKAISENKVEIQERQTEYDDKKTIVDSEQTYIDGIARLTSEKQELFQNGFPNTNAENLHAFMTKEAAEASVTIGKIAIDQAPRVAANSAGVEVETGIMDNVLSEDITGNYPSIISLITKIEEIQKTSLLTGFTISSAGTEDKTMTASLNYTFLSADKKDIEDTVFDHEFGQAVGDEALFK